MLVRSHLGAPTPGWFGQDAAISSGDLRYLNVGTLHARRERGAYPLMRRLPTGCSYLNEVLVVGGVLLGYEDYLLNFIRRSVRVLAKYAEIRIGERG